MGWAALNTILEILAEKVDGPVGWRRADITRYKGRTAAECIRAVAIYKRI